jgi:hypothetical protein
LPTHSRPKQRRNTLIKCQFAPIHICNGRLDSADLAAAIAGARIRNLRYRKAYRLPPAHQWNLAFRGDNLDMNGRWPGHQIERTWN